MALKDNFMKQISLRCMTCGATYAFETNEKTGYVTCRKCNRVYRGGKEELINLNEAFIEDEKDQLLDEVKIDYEKEFQRMIKNLKI